MNPHTDGITDKELLHAIYTALAPEGAEPTPPTDAQAAEIVRRAHKRRRQRFSARLRILRRSALGLCLTGAAITGVIAVVNALGVDVAPDTQNPAGPGAAPRPALLALPDASQWQPARTGLTALADTVRNHQESRPAGRYTYTRTRSWSLDTTATDPYKGATVRDEQRWWASDLSGREAVATVPGWIPGTAPGPVPTPDPDGDIRYAQGLLPVVVPDLSQDVLVVSSQLADQGDPADGPQQTLRAVREVYRYHAPTAAQRSALLQALADTDGLMIAGTVDGGTGRRGLAVVVDRDKGATRDIAVFDPVNGRLLAYDTVMLRNPPGVRLSTPAVSDSLLFIDAGHTGRL